MAKGKRNGAGKSRGRRGKTVDKADKVERREAMAELAGLSLDEKKKLEGKIPYHMAQIKGYKEKVTTAQSRVRNAYKAAKADHVSSKTIDFLLGLDRVDPNEVRRELEAQGIGLKIVGAPFQLAIYDTAYKNPVEQAKAEARIQARGGRAAESRWPEGSPEHEAYMEEFSRIQAERVPGADLLSEAERSAAVKEGLEARH